MGPSPTCNRGLEGHAAEHMLQRCPLLQTARTKMLPTAVQLHANSTAAGRNWRRRLQSSCRLDSQCSGDREEEETESEYSMSQYKLQGDLFLRCTVTNRINNRLINTQQRLKTHQTHTTYYVLHSQSMHYKKDSHTGQGIISDKNQPLPPWLHERTTKRLEKW